MNSKKLFKMYSLMIIMTIISSIIGLFIMNLFHKEKLSPIVWLSNIQVGGMDKTNVENILQNFQERINNQFLSIKIKDLAFQYPASFLQPEVDIENTIKELFGDDWKRSFHAVLLEKVNPSPRIILPIVKLNMENLSSIVSEIDSKVSHTSQNATVEFKNNTIHILSSIAGSVVDKKKLSDEIVLAYQKGLHFTIEENKDNVLLKKIEPFIQEKDLEKITDVIGIAEVPLYNLAKKNDVLLSLQSLHKVLILPWKQTLAWNRGEISFLSTIRKENSKEIQPEANNIVAKALYDAAKQADLQPKLIQNGDRIFKERQQDQIEVTQSLMDVRFRNNTEDPILIWTELKTDTIVVTILGKKISFSK